MLFINESASHDDLLDSCLERFDTPLFVLSDYDNEKVIKIDKDNAASIEKIVHFILKHVDGLLSTSSSAQNEEP